MKRGKNDEKMIGPMFPRLHVNDTEKGGPRAPPRNKMALYEQLSIPSRTFNPGVLPSNQNHSRNMVPPVSTNQSKKFDAGNAHGLDGNVQLAQLERRKKAGDEEDYRVPDFVQSRAGQCHGEVQNDINREKLASISPKHTAYQMELQNVCEMSQEERNESEENPKLGGLGCDHSKWSTVDQLTSENIHRTAKNAETSSDQEFRKNPALYSNGLLVNEVFRPQEHRAWSQPASTAGDCGIINSAKGIDDGVVPEPRCVSHFSKNHGSPKVIGNNCESNGDRRCMSLQLGSEDKSDDVSEASMVDSLSGSDLSPDDVVGIIGQRHFWKARREIVNQQRVFAVQVFELHRLIKVQRLIAGSPNLMLEDGAFLGKSPLKGSPTKKLPSEYAVKLLPRVIKRKDFSEKPVQKMEHSAENAVGKTSLSSVKNGQQLSSYEPYVGNPTPTPVSSDNKMAPWCFHQSSGHQWLIPVMSPSEGLVYKPYPGSEFMGTVSGGCGPYGSTPMTGNFTNPSHGIPTSQHHAMGGFLGASPVGHPYYAPYGMPVTNPATTGSAFEQMNQSLNCGTSHGSHNQVGPVSEEGAYRSMQHQGVCNALPQKKGTVAQGLKFQVYRDSDLQGSTAGSPGEKRTQGIGMGHSAEGKDPLSLFPFTPAVPDDASQHNDADYPSRVIKVVPHNPRSATESAARIFQSIQEERKQYDSI